VGAVLGGACRAGGPPAGVDDPLAPAQRGPSSTTARTTSPASTAPPPPTFVPTPEIAALAVSMSDEGKRIFYATDPKVLDRAEFAPVCPKADHAQVLGCFTGERIYILRVARPELAGVMETTAVHEMLHAVYSAMASRERAQVDTWVDGIFAGVKDDGLRALVASYERSEPGQRLNELHSILPTQLPTLDPRLEDHYRRYVAARQRVVGAYQAYSGVLAQLERRIDDFQADITRRKAELEALEARIKADKATLEGLNRRLEGLEARGDVAGYNRLIPQQNTQVRALNALVDRHDRLVDVHNLKVREVNALALQQNQLVDSLEGKKP